MKNEIHELLNLCIEKGFNFTFFPSTYGINVGKIINKKVVFSETCYIESDLKDYEYENTITLPKLIELVKNY